jgi:NCAIR mutase (PurE)-related protein
VGIERTMQQIQEMRRQQASQLVVAPGMPGLKDGPRGGGKIQMP